jgi:hypothetical protein
LFYGTEQNADQRDGGGPRVVNADAVKACRSIGRAESPADQRHKQVGIEFSATIDDVRAAIDKPTVLESRVFCGIAA